MFWKVKAKFENDSYHILDKDEVLIAEIKTNLKSRFKENEIVIGTETYKIVRERSSFIISKEAAVVFHLERGSFWKGMTIPETQQKIKGVKGTKWGTQLVDKEDNSLLKIRNENKFRDTKVYKIEIVDKEVQPFAIALTLFGHLYGSDRKSKLGFLIMIILASIYLTIRGFF